MDIVSIRAGEVYTENAEPVNGHRLLIQALVKFDTTQVSGFPPVSVTSMTRPRYHTTQNIEIIDKRGQVMNSDLAGPRQVVQYLLLEKVGWYDTPWKIKDQYYKS